MFITTYSDLSPAGVPRVVRLSYAMASRSSHLQLGQCIAPQQNTEEHYSRDFKKVWYFAPDEIYVYSTQYTAATGIAGLPEFTAVSFLHGKQIDYYDSNCHTLFPRQEWAKRVLGEEGTYWQRTAHLRYSESLQLVNGLRSAMESSGHKEVNVQNLKEE
ncbi:hypothetical protein NFI96_005418 [Prochilodus magdalenae]|nr:hypothetical protein NFI96_005418 [Prochilodus magdalenae]